MYIRTHLRCILCCIVRSVAQSCVFADVICSILSAVQALSYRRDAIARKDNHHDHTARHSAPVHTCILALWAKLIVHAVCAAALWVVAIVFSCDRGIGAFATSRSFCSHLDHTSWWDWKWEFHFRHEHRPLNCHPRPRSDCLCPCPPLFLSLDH